MTQLFSESIFPDSQLGTYQNIQQMLQRIVEKFLIKYLQRYLDGLDHKNIHVGLLSGHFTIESIGLQQSVFNQLNLPIKLSFSYVQKISINYPWRQTASNMVINIENIYAVLTPKEENQYNFAKILMENKEKLIRETIKEFDKQIKEEKKKAGQKTGYFRTFLNNLIDNIELRIKSIHIRYENKAEQFSFGITLNQILIQTRDHYGKKFYFNRQKTNEKYVNQVLQVNRFGVYWNSTNKKWLQHMEAAELINQMYNMSISNMFFDQYPLELKDGTRTQQLLQYIFNIDMVCSLKKYLSPDGIDPEYDCDVKFQEIEFKVSHAQYCQMIWLVKHFLYYQQLWKQEKQDIEMQNFKLKSASEILEMLRQKKFSHKGDETQYTTKYVRSYLAYIFKIAQEQIIMKKFMRLVLQKPIKEENILKNPQLRRIIYKTDADKIKQWLEITLKLRAQIKKEYGAFRMASHQAVNLRIQETANTAYRQEKENNKNIPEEEELSLDETGVTLASLSNKDNVKINLTAGIESGKVEIAEGDFGLQISWYGLNLKLKTRKQGMLADLVMDDFMIKMFDSWGPGGRAYIDILKKTPTLQFNHKNSQLLKISIDKNPVLRPQVFMDVGFELKSIELTAFPSSLLKLFSFLYEGIKSTETEQQEPKQENIKTEREVKSTNVKSRQNQKNIISAKIHSPWIIIPFSKVNDKKSECWVIRLGDFETSTPESDDIEAAKHADAEFYDHYVLTLSNFDLKYYSSIYFFYSTMKFGATEHLVHLLNHPLMEKGNSLNVIQPFSALVNLHKIKKHLSEGLKQNIYEMKVWLNIQELRFNVSTLIISKLKSLLSQFSNKEDIPQFLQHSKDEIIVASSLRGHMRINYGIYKNIKFYGVLAGKQLYLYSSERSKTCQLQFNLQYVKVYFIDTEQMIQRLVINRNTADVLHLYFDSTSEISRWISNIEKSLLLPANNSKKSGKMEKPAPVATSNEIRSKNNLVEEPLPVQKKKTKYHARFTIDHMHMIMYDKEIELVSCDISKLKCNIIQSIERGFDLKLKDIELRQSSHKIPVVLSSRLLSIAHDQGTFLDLKLTFNKIGVMNEVNIKINNLLLVWKVEVIQKVMGFFLENMNQAKEDKKEPQPNPPPRKSEIAMSIFFKNFHLLCTHKHYCAGIIKAYCSLIEYKVTPIHEIYLYQAEKFEVFNYENDEITKQFPLFTTRSDLTKLQFKSVYTSFRPPDPSSPTKNRQSLSNIQMKLPPSQLRMIIRGYNATYQHEQFMRMNMYMINKFIGSITSRFKTRKDYTDEYIYEVMKTKKIANYRIELVDCIMRIHDIPFSEEYLKLDCKRMVIEKNLDPHFMPREDIIDTKKGPMNIWYEKFIFKLENFDIFYRNTRRFERLKINNAPWHLQMQYNKWSLSKEYFGILKNIDDLDRTTSIIVDLYGDMEFNLQKIVFYMMLKIYYRNIKQKDGLAEEYEPPLPYPTPRQYKIRIPSTSLLLSQESQGHFKPFSLIKLSEMRIDARQVRTLVKAIIKIDTIFVKYEDALNKDILFEPWKKDEQTIFKMDMQSDRGVINADLILRNYKVGLDMNQLDTLVDYFDFDADHVENKRMPKKGKSFQNFRIAWKDGIATISNNSNSIDILGLVFINLAKNPGSDLEEQVTMYLGSPDRNLINEKQLKVNAENITLFLNGMKITELPNFLYNRHEYTVRSINKRHRREDILLQHMDICFFLGFIQILQSMYKYRIKKAKTKKSFFDPATGIPAKKKYEDRRLYSIDGQPIGINIMHRHQNSTYPAIKLILDFKKLKIIMISSVVKNVSTVFNLTVLNRGLNLNLVEILHAKNMILSYDSESGDKKISIHDNTLTLNTYNVNEVIVNNMLESRAQLMKRQFDVHCFVKIINDTENNLTVEIFIKKTIVITGNLLKFESRNIPLGHYELSRIYDDDVKIRIYLAQQDLEATIDVRQMDCSQLINVDNKYYLAIEHRGLLTIRLMAQFKVENKTSLRFRYRLRENRHSSKTMLTLQQFSSMSIVFKPGSELILFDQIEQQETVIKFVDHFEPRTNYSYRTTINKQSMSTLVISPRLLFVNMLPLQISISHSKFLFEARRFETKQIYEHHFKSKKQVTIELADRKFKCSTDIFLRYKEGKKSNLLELTNAQNKVQNILELEIQNRDDSILWILKPQVILSNFTGGNLSIVRNDHIYTLPHASSIVGNRDEPFIVKSTNHQFKINSKVLKLYEEVQAGEYIITYMNMKNEGIKVPSVVVYSHISIMNETKHQLIIENKVLPPKSFGRVSPLENNMLSFSLGTETKYIDVDKPSEKYFFINHNNQRQESARVTLKMETVNFAKRKLIKVEEQVVPSKYWIKNNCKGFTMTMRQAIPNSRQTFTIPECSERGISLQDPNQQEKYEIQFYYNMKNVDFVQKAYFEPYRQPKVSHIGLAQQSYQFVIKMTFEKTKASYTLSFQMVEVAVEDPPTNLQISIMKLILKMKFSPTEEESSLWLMLENLMVNVIKERENTTIYNVLLQQFRGKFKNSQVISRNNNNKPFLDVSATISKPIGHTIMHEVKLLPSSFMISIHEEFLYEVATFLKKFDVISSKIAQRRLVNQKMMEALKSNDRQSGTAFFQVDFIQGQKQKPKEESRLTVKGMKIGALTLILSYLKDARLNTPDFRSHNILKYLIIIPNMKELKVSLSDFELQNFQGTDKQFKKKLTSHLKKCLPSSIGSSISSLSIFENPVETIGMFTNIVNGVWSIT